MWHSHLNDMEIHETKRFIPKGFELGATLSQPIRSIETTLIAMVPVVQRLDSSVN